MNPPRLVAAGLLVVAFALFATACGGVKNPEGWASPVDQDSTLYYFPKKDRVSAVELEDGFARQTWTFPGEDRDDQKDLKFKAVYDATLADGVLYFGSWEGRVLALSADTGEVEWTLDDGITGGIVGGPVASGGLVAFGTTEGRVYVRRAEDGTAAPNWPNGGLDLPKGIWAAPVFANGNLYVATMGGELWAYDVATAQPVWDKPFDASGAIADLSMIGEDRLFVPSLNKKIYIVDAATGARIGEPFVAEDWIWTRPAVADGVAYFGDFSGRVYALDITTMREKWPAYESGKRIKSAPVVINGTLVVATRDPEIHFIDITNGRPLNVVPIEDVGTVRASLLEHDGMAVVATTKGRLLLADPERWAVTPLNVAGAQ